MIEWIISSGVLIVVIAGVRFLFQGKISPTFQYMLWGLVLLRLLIPFHWWPPVCPGEMPSRPVMRQGERAEYGRTLIDMTCREGTEAEYRAAFARWEEEEPASWYSE